jgi:hypothetical protein
MLFILAGRTCCSLWQRMPLLMHDSYCMAGYSAASK